MANSICRVIKTKKIKCPECLNFIIAEVRENKDMYALCPSCNSTIIAKQHSDKEKLIRIVKHS